MSAPRPGLIGSARTFGRSLSLVWRHRELWAWCALPLLVNIAAFGLAAWVFLDNLDAISALVRDAIALADPVHWYEWLWVGPLRALAWLSRWLLLAVFGVLVYLLFTVVGGLVAAPFLDVLSQRLERIVTGGNPEPDTGLVASLASAGRAVREEGKRVAFLLVVQALLLTLALVPGLQPAVVVANLVFACLFLSLDYTGYVLDRRGVRFRERRSWVWRHRRAMLGFGGIALLTFMVPGLNFLCLPWLVASGTLLALDVGPPLPRVSDPQLADGRGRLG